MTADVVICEDAAEEETAVARIEAMTGKHVYRRPQEPQWLCLLDHPYIENVDEAIARVKRTQQPAIVNRAGLYGTWVAVPRRDCFVHCQDRTILADEYAMEALPEPLLRLSPTPEAILQLLVKHEARKQEKLSSIRDPTQRSVTRGDFTRVASAIYEKIPWPEPEERLRWTFALEVIMAYDKVYGRAAVNKFLAPLKKRWHRNPKAHFKRFNHLCWNGYSSDAKFKTLCAFLARFRWKPYPDLARTRT